MTNRAIIFIETRCRLEEWQEVWFTLTIILLIRGAFGVTVSIRSFKRSLSMSPGMFLQIAPKPLVL